MKSTTSSPTCMINRGDKNTLLFREWRICQSMRVINRILPALLGVFLGFEILTPNSMAVHSKIAWLSGCSAGGGKRVRVRGLRRLAAVQNAKTMQALAARTTSSSSYTARVCPDCHHSLHVRVSDTIDPAPASIRVSSRAVMSSLSDAPFRVPVSSTL